MTVAEMTPIQLFAVIMCALVLFSLAVIGLREIPKVEARGSRAIMWIGAAALLGLPCIITVMMINGWWR